MQWKQNTTSSNEMRPKRQALASKLTMPDEPGQWVSPQLLVVVAVDFFLERVALLGVSAGGGGLSGSCPGVRYVS